VVPAADGHRVLLAGRPLQCIDAPGHARHHLVVWDEISHEVYTGDAFGLAYPELRVAGRPFVMPSSTPTQFDPQAMRQTVQRIADLQPRAAYLTHGSHLAHPAQHAPDLLRRLDAYITMAQTVHAQVGPDPAQLGPALERGMTELLTQALHEHGCTLPSATQHALLELDIRLNAAGLLHWLLHS